MSHKEVPGAQPWFGDTLEPMLGHIREVLTSGQLVQGQHVGRFEQKMAEMVGTEHALAVSSGGTALELALLALGVAGREVIVPTQTFIASANAVTRAGGRPVFADVSPDTLCLDPEDVLRRIGPETCGVMFVHMFGLVPPSVLEIRKICRERGLFLIEDAAHAHGASLGEEKAGSIGDVGCFSFFATKVVTSGEGGMVTTNNGDLSDKVKSLRDHGRCKGAPTFCVPGNNFRLTEIQGVLGWNQMDLLPQIVAHRNLVAAIYHEELRGCGHVSPLPVFPSVRHAYWRFPAYLAEGVDRVLFQQAMWERHKIRITWMYEPLCHLQPVYADSQHGAGFLVAESTGARLINLPTHMGVSPETARRVAQAAVAEAGRLAQ